MSFDLFLQTARDGDTFKRTLFEEIMSRGAINPELPLEDVNYPDGGCREIVIEDEEDIDSASFSRFGGDTFFQRLWELADRTNSFIWWPDVGSPVAVTRQDMISQLPEGVLDAEEDPYVVRSGKELENAILFAIEPDEPEGDDEGEESG
jgi:hypothetical protein